MKIFRYTFERRIFPFALAVAILTMTGCVHQVDVQQGNVFTQETLQQLQIGMEQRKIKGLAGTPLINDPFHPDRWEYVYRFYDGEKDRVQYSYVTLFFKDEKLVEIKVNAEPLKDKDINTLHNKIRGNRS